MLLDAAACVDLNGREVHVRRKISSKQANQIDDPRAVSAVKAYNDWARHARVLVDDGGEPKASGARLKPHELEEACDR